MKKYNLKSIIAGLVVTILGILMIVCDIFWWKTNSMVWVSIGCSLIASALVILLNTFLVDAQIYNPLDDWKIVKITATRAEINADCEIELDKVKKQVDIVAFGLQSFRSRHPDKKIADFLKRGVNFRILTMDPEGQFIEARETEEDDSNIKNSINKLIEWADEINKKSSKGKIIIKGYSSMTLDFYWRCDNTLYVGPYWYNCGSQQTITYKYINGGTGFKTYTDYFENLWDNETLSRILTTATTPYRHK